MPCVLKRGRSVSLGGGRRLQHPIRKFTEWHSDLVGSIFQGNGSRLIRGGRFWEMGVFVLVLRIDRSVSAVCLEACRQIVQADAVSES
jgi:hypothetical protein